MFAEKKALREELRRRRSALVPFWRDAMDQDIAARVWSLPAYAACGTLFTYVSVKQEVDTRDLIRTALRDGKRVAVPRCEGKQMVFYPIGSLEELIGGGFGLLEPPSGGEPAVPEKRDICLVPGFSFDRRGARIGYGGGFYDRFLPSFPGVAVGLCYSPLFSDDLLPVEPHDRFVALVATDRKLWETGAGR